MDYTPEQLEVLETAWEGGMKVAGKTCIKEIEEVATALGVATDRVKEWIGNRNAKVRADGGGRPAQRNTVAIPTGTNGYSQFAKTVPRGNMNGKEYFGHVKHLWNTLEPHEREGYCAAAKVIRDDPYKGQPRDRVISSQLKIINQACEVLQSIGYNVCGLGLDKEHQSAPSLFGTSDGLRFIDIDLQDRFRLFLNGNATFQPVQPLKKDNEQKELRQSVRRHFNSSWCNSTNLKGGLPYKEILTGKIQVDVQGLPDGVLFKDPSSYGTSTLKSILDRPIVFKISNKEDAAPGNDVTTAAPKQASACQSTSVASQSTSVASQSTSVASQSTSVASQFTSVASQSTSVASQSTSVASQSTSVASQSMSWASQSTSAPSHSTSSQSTAVPCQSTSAPSQSMLVPSQSTSGAYQSVGLKKRKQETGDAVDIFPTQEKRKKEETMILVTDEESEIILRNIQMDPSSLEVVHDLEEDITEDLSDFQDKPVFSLTDIKTDQKVLYKIKEIIDRKKDGRRYLYKVLWDGYPVEQATWEPRTDFETLAKAYDKKMKKKL